MSNYSSIPANEGTPERRAQPLMAESPSKWLQLERSLLIALINLVRGTAAGEAAPGPAGGVVEHPWIVALGSRTVP